MLESIADPNQKIHWLSDIGRSFPIATMNYIHAVASYFHSQNVSLPQAFVDILINFIRETKSHVATINYDPLIYNTFIEKGILLGYSGSLVDGMPDKGFSEDALKRLHGNNFGYYMHLHGSPLFYDYQGIVKNHHVPN